jgi:membrane protein YdbS with pleckstrin-like domain
MKRSFERTARWMYRGLWGVLVDLFRVPHHAPTLPVAADEQVDSFQPAEGFLKYLQFWFWILLLLTDIAILVGWVAVTAHKPWLGALLLLPALVLAVVPDILAFVAIHLRFDTTWYVMTDRSLRIRRGIWIIHETTITFENVQNVKIKQGPVQRAFDISNIIVETAGAGESEKHGSVANQGIIEGISNAAELRDRILARMRGTTSAGLGDEDEARRGAGLSEAHVAVLREIRDEVDAMRV